MREIKSNTKDKMKALQMLLVDKKPQWYIAKKFRVSRKTIWEWSKRYDGTIKSLNNKSSRPHTAHPSSQTEQEKRYIKTIIEQNPTWGYTEIFGELRTKFAYTRHYLTMYKYIVNSCLKVADCIEKYVAKPYNTPDKIGQKWRLIVSLSQKSAIMVTLIAIQNLPEHIIISTR
ncbi:MAG: hypothetical protein FWF56_06090 [Firmicutes bacterium]|nr:hypothetical protein [Bacillota bacterium]MCL1953949.1 hypothetical protein [Bacillota bacterium]